MGQIRTGLTNPASHGTTRLHDLGLNAVRQASTITLKGTIQGTESMAVNTIDGLMSSLTFSKTVPALGFLNKSKNPQRGFEPFRTPTGTEIAFFRHQDLPPDLATLVKDSWSHGIGLVVFRNPKLTAWGMVFLHSLAKINSPEGQVLKASGGTMIYPSTVSIKKALSNVVTKGVSMTWKWLVVAMLYELAGFHGVTFPSGSKGVLIHGNEQDSAFETYGDVLNFIGCHETGRDEGFAEDKISVLGRFAPKYVVGGDFVQGGFDPVPWTKAGVFKSIRTFFDIRGGSLPILVHGAGNIGGLLVPEFIQHSLPICGVVDNRTGPLQMARDNGYRGPLFLVSSGSPDGALPANCTVVPDLAEAMRIVNEGGSPYLLSPNASPGLIGCKEAESALESRLVSASAGAANDPFFLSQVLELALCAGGIFTFPHFGINACGAAAVASGKANANEEGMKKVVMAQGVMAQRYWDWFQQGRVPVEALLEEVQEIWRRRVMEEGSGVGGIAI